MHEFFVVQVLNFRQNLLITWPKLKIVIDVVSVVCCVLFHSLHFVIWIFFSPLKLLIYFCR